MKELIKAFIFSFILVCNKALLWQRATTKIKNKNQTLDELGNINKIERIKLKKKPKTKSCKCFESSFCYIKTLMKMDLVYEI